MYSDESPPNALRAHRVVAYMYVLDAPARQQLPYQSAVHTHRVVADVLDAPARQQLPDQSAVHTHRVVANVLDAPAGQQLPDQRAVLLLHRDVQRRLASLGRATIDVTAGSQQRSGCLLLPNLNASLIASSRQSLRKNHAKMPRHGCR